MVHSVRRSQCMRSALWLAFVRRGSHPVGKPRELSRSLVGTLSILLFLCAPKFLWGTPDTDISVAGKVIEVSGGGRAPWKLRYGLASSTSSEKIDETHLIQDGSGRAYFSHGQCLRQIDTDAWPLAHARNNHTDRSGKRGRQGRDYCGGAVSRKKELHFHFRFRSASPWSPNRPQSRINLRKFASRARGSQLVWRRGAAC
jgi:hypothetical protein